MPRIAANLLMTSLGTIRTGEEIPATLPKVELDVIRNAGGMLGEEPGQTAETKPAVRAKSEIKAAERAVLDAEAAVQNASTPKDRDEAEAVLADARQALLDLKND
jgi:hypothetical protein